MRRCCWARNRALTSSGRLGLLAMFQRSTALDATLLTFCPPGPPERTKLQSNSSSGIRILSLITSIGHPRRSTPVHRSPLAPRDEEGGQLAERVGHTQQTSSRGARGPLTEAETSREVYCSDTTIRRGVTGWPHAHAATPLGMRLS